MSAWVIEFLTWGCLAAAALAAARWCVGSRGRAGCCARCGYDVGSLRPGEGGLRCPECGLAGADERVFRRIRVRRRRWLGVAGVLALAAYTAAAWPWVRARGWWGALPTPVLAAGLPIWNLDDESATRAALSSELRYRHGAGELNGWKGKVWIERTRLAGAWGAYDAPREDGPAPPRPPRRVVAYDLSDFIAEQPIPRFYPTRHPDEHATPMPPDRAREDVRRWVMDQVQGQVESLIASEAWVDNGGSDNDTVAVGHALVVLADDAVQARIVKLLALLRGVGASAQARCEAGRASDLDHARRALAWVGDWSGPEPGSVDVVRLSEAVRVPVLPPRACDPPGASAPQGWTWSCEDGGVRMVPQECLAGSAFIAVYGTSGLPTNDPESVEVASSICERVRESLRTREWFDGGRCVVWADTLGPRLVVLADAVSHARIERLLERAHSEQLGERP